MKNKKIKWIIIVNIITFLRIIGSILIYPLYKSYGNIVFGIIVALFFSTDWVDGYLARKKNVCTFFGAMLDSVSDKVFAFSSCITLACTVNPYMLIIFAIEILILLTNSVIFCQKGNLKSSYIGKTKMWFLAISITVSFIFSKVNRTLLNIAITAPVIIIDLIALIGYILKFKNLNFKIEKKKPHYNSFKTILSLLFDPEFYSNNKNSKGLIDYIYNE